MNIYSITNYHVTAHARFEMARRGISESEVTSTLLKPEQAFPVQNKRMVYQSRFYVRSLARIYLLRVFVDIDRKPPEVVTAYRTSKIKKYWRN